MESKPEKVVREASHDVTCDFVDGFAFGDALGVGLRSVDGWWTVEELVLPNDLPFVSYYMIYGLLMTIIKDPIPRASTSHCVANPESHRHRQGSCPSR